jgi:hypothetical protein
VTEHSGPRTGRGALAVALIILGILFAVLYRYENSRENHSYNDGGAAPIYVHLTAGKQYEISTPGGMDALVKVGSSASALNCNYTPQDGPATAVLTTTSLGTGTRTTHAVATFSSPVTGLVRVECRALQSTYIDDADNVGGDPAGLYLLLCTITLSVGAMLGLSALYWRRRPERSIAVDEGPENAPDPLTR